MKFDNPGFLRSNAMRHSKERMRRILGILMGLGILISAAQGVQVPSIFSSHMVLQRDMKLPVWGWAKAGEKVMVTFNGAVESATADADGRWSVALPATAAGGPYTMTIAGTETITLEDILVGEVWLCSGQSNMEMGIEMVKNGKQEAEEANYPQMRLFLVKRRASAKPENDAEKCEWKFCKSDNIRKDGWGGFSATGYFFGRALHRQLDVPIGLIESSWGGTLIEPWTPLVGFQQVPALKNILMQIEQTPEQYRQTIRETLAKYSDWMKTAEVAVEAKQDVPLPPAWPKNPLESEGKPLSLYNGMIHPLVPFAIRGAIWYQGESNCAQKDGMLYYEKMKALIGGWRTVWNEGDFPFYYVQLASWDYSIIKGFDDPTELPRLWEAQTASLAVPNTGMAVTLDLVDNLKDIHPANKKDVGERLALWALAKTYGMKDIVYSGPLYKSIRVEGNAIRIFFDHTAEGLVSRDGKPLSWFEIAGAGKKFAKAEAAIDPATKTVVVTSSEVKSPVAVRFAWHQLAQPNLMNSAKLPAGPFRTDPW
jgi:sialate O-acetylesterase